MLKLKRVYQGYNKEDGFRVLVDRLWPRGISKEVAHIDLWLKDIAPSKELRTWFNHDPKKWQEFQKRYCRELDKNPETVAKLKKISQEEKVVTLLYGAKDESENNAVVLIDYLNK